MLHQEEHDLPSEERARHLQSILVSIITDMATAFSNNAAEDTSVRINATMTIESVLWRSDGNISRPIDREVNKILAGTIEKAIQEVLNRCGSREEERQAQEATDVEQGGVEHLECGACYTMLQMSFHSSMLDFHFCCSVQASLWVPSNRKKLLTACINDRAEDAVRVGQNHCLFTGHR
ncbi:unnamed protein product [Urochloa humidicola]